MIVEVVAVGTELLLGQITNSNATFIGDRLARRGFDAHFQQVVGDNLERVEMAIRDAMARSGAVIITGGLGPTQDDLTREGICAATGLDLVHDDAMEDEIRRRFVESGREMPSSNRRQADHPQGATLLPNSRGTAPGLWLEHQGVILAAVPGVPGEMMPLVDEYVLPRLEALRGEDRVLVSRVIRCWGLPESAIAETLDDLYTSSVNPSVAFLASAAEIKVRLTASAASESDARTLIAPFESEVRARLGKAVFGSDDEDIEHVLIGLGKDLGWTIGSAESATGGMIAARITSVPGASEVFRGSIVAYASDLKEQLLGVAVGPEGVVSEEVAVAMAEGARECLGVDVAVAVTGSAGPDPLERQVGTMIIGVATPDGTRARTFRFPGDRERVRSYGSTAALQCLRLGMTGEWW